MNPQMKSLKTFRSDHRYLIGIDPGVNTGITVWDKKAKKLHTVSTSSIHEAMSEVNTYRKTHPGQVFVRFEDARLRKWFGNAGREQLQGAGSIKRDCKIWEDYLTHIGIEFEMVPPRNNKTKLDADKFRQLTGYTGRTSNHARDSAMLVFGL